MDVEPGKSLVNGSPHRQGQTPRAGGGGAPSDAAGPGSYPYDQRRSGECRRGFGDGSRSDQLRAGPAQDRAAMASISTPAPSGRAATPKAARAGRVSPVK